MSSNGTSHCWNIGSATAPTAPRASVARTTSAACGSTSAGAAIWLVNTMFALAAMYILLDAHFIGAIQVIVYAGAIMVVFLFVIMLLNLGHPEEIADARGMGWKLGAGVVGLALIAMLMALTRERLPAGLLKPYGAMERAVEEQGAIVPVAAPLFAARDYLLAFEITSVLLLAAIVGAVVLAKRRL